MLLSNCKVMKEKSKVILSARIRTTKGLYSLIVYSRCNRVQVSTVGTTKGMIGIDNCCSHIVVFIDSEFPLAAIGVLASKCSRNIRSMSKERIQLAGK